MRHVVDSYIRGFNDRSVDAILALYDPDATIEDPVGTELVRGHEAIHAFYTGALAGGAVLTLDGPVRTAADTCAFPFHATTPTGHRIDIIDVFRFGPNGTILQMRATWSPGQP